MNYRDPVLRDAKAEFEASVSAAGIEKTKALADKLRHSDNRTERIRSAVGYLVVAEKLQDQDQLDATYCFHFSGQGFRLEGLTSKAARSYELSYDAGTRLARNLFMQGETEQAQGLQKFNDRSIGRAIVCFRDSGQYREKIRSLVKSEDSKIERYLFEGKWLERIVYQIWKNLLGYSLSWQRAWIAASVLLFAAFLSPVLSSIFLQGVAATIIWFAFARRVLD